MERREPRIIDAAIGLVADVAAIGALAWLIYQMVLYWARVTGRM